MIVRTYSHTREIKRGDIYYVRKGNGESTGAEIRADRPALIVSNDIGNHHSPVVEVVYLTTQEKNNQPTHVKLMGNVPSTALCEQIHSVYKDRLGGYMRSCTKEEMDAIDNALMISLGIEVEQNDPSDVAELKMKCEMYKEQYNAILEKLIGR